MNFNKKGVIILAKRTNWTKPGKIKGEKGKPNVVVRTLDLIYSYQTKNTPWPTEITTARMHQLARKYDPTLLKKVRLNWGLTFLVKLGHLKRLDIGRYKILK